MWTKTWTGRQSFEGSMYTEKEKEKALGLYDKTKSITEAIRRLGYANEKPENILHCQKPVALFNFFLSK